MDTLNQKQRSYCMSQIKSRHTKIELQFKKYLRAMGITGHSFSEKIRGKPDLFFRTKKLAVFIDGCFWHKCPKCFVRPKTKKKFWNEKIENNVRRDKKIVQLLKKNDICSIRFWEHQINNDIEKCFTKFKKIYDKR